MYWVIEVYPLHAMCLRDFEVEMVPVVDLWIHELPLHKHTSFLEPCWMHEASLRLPGSWSGFLFPFCTARSSPFALPTFFSHVLREFLCILRLPDQ